VKLRALLALIAVCACADDEAATLSDHDIAGVVRDEYSDHGVSGAKVVFVSDTLERFETLSEGDGQFTLRVEVPQGVLFGTIEASHSGYSDSAAQSVYFDGTAPRVELRIRPAK